jgi:hypothetical protein
MAEMQLLKQSFHGCRMCLLYVNDALILLQLTTQQIAMLKMDFNIFHKLSGLIKGESP